MKDFGFLHLWITFNLFYSHICRVAAVPPPSRYGTHRDDVVCDSPSRVRNSPKNPRHRTYKLILLCLILFWFEVFFLRRKASSEWWCDEWRSALCVVDCYPCLPVSNGWLGLVFSLRCRSWEYVMLTRTSKSDPFLSLRCLRRYARPYPPPPPPPFVIVLRLNRSCAGIVRPPLKDRVSWVGKILPS